MNGSRMQPSLDALTCLKAMAVGMAVVGAGAGVGTAAVAPLAEAAVAPEAKDAAVPALRVATSAVYADTAVGHRGEQGHRVRKRGGAQQREGSGVAGVKGHTHSYLHSLLAFSGGTFLASAWLQGLH